MHRLCVLAQVETTIQRVLSSPALVLTVFAPIRRCGEGKSLSLLAGLRRYFDGTSSTAHGELPHPHLPRPVAHVLPCSSHMSPCSQVPVPINVSTVCTCTSSASDAGGKHTFRVSIKRVSKEAPNVYHSVSNSITLYPTVSILYRHVSCKYFSTYLRNIIFCIIYVSHAYHTQYDTAVIPRDTYMIHLI